MASTFGPQFPLSNLVYYLDPYNTKSYSGSGTTAYNLVDNLPSTLSSISYTSSSFSNATSGAITSAASYNLSLTNGFTVLQFLNLTSRTGGFFSYNAGSNSINLSTGGLTPLRWETYAAGGDLYSNTTVPLNQWHCWICTFAGVASGGTGATSSIYYNGVLDNSGTINGPSSNNAVFQLGAQIGPCNGLIGPTAFWNTALSASQVRAAFVALKGRYGI